MGQNHKVHARTWPPLPPARAAILMEQLLVLRVEPSTTERHSHTYAYLAGWLFLNKS